MKKEMKTSERGKHISNSIILKLLVPKCLQVIMSLVPLLVFRTKIGYFFKQIRSVV